MTLLFQQRIAHNYAKDGYYPTDNDTTQRILSALSPCPQGEMRIIDPCAGEGVALAECKHQSGPDRTEAFAVEYHQERAYQAKKRVDRCIHGDFQETLITPRSFGLLWLNPPYGDLVTDKAQSGGENDSKGRKRLEKLFFQQSARLLQYGGILVLIVPHTTLDQEFRRWLAAGFDRLRVFLAPEQQFKQASGSRYFCESFYGHPCPTSGKNYATANAFGGPSRPASLVAYPAGGMQHRYRNDSTRFRKACIFTTQKALRENTCPIASGDYSTPVSQRR